MMSIKAYSSGSEVAKQILEEVRRSKGLLYEFVKSNSGRVAYTDSIYVDGGYYEVSLIGSATQNLTCELRFGFSDSSVEIRCFEDGRVKSELSVRDLGAVDVLLNVDFNGFVDIYLVVGMMTSHASSVISSETGGKK